MKDVMLELGDNCIVHVFENLQASVVDSEVAN